MARGFVKKRGDTWYSYWRDQAGKQHAKAIGPRKKDAEAYLVRVQKEVNEDTFREIKKVTFADFANLWLNDYASTRVKPSTLEGYRGILRSSLVPCFGENLLTSITSEQIQHYIAIRLKEGKAPATVRKAFIVLKSMLQQAIIWNYLKVNPAANVKPPRNEVIEMDFLTPSEIRVFLEALEDKWKPFFMTAIFTGLRLGELRALQWSDIDWNSTSIRVRRNIWRGRFQEPKSKSGVRSIGMTPTLTRVLRSYAEIAPSSEQNLVFCTENGAVLDDSNLRSRVFEPTLAKAGLRKIRLHDLRHTFATLLINQGENLKYVQQQLGHASITTTVDRYGHLMPDAHKGVGARLDETIFGEVEV